MPSDPGILPATISRGQTDKPPVLGSDGVQNPQMGFDLSIARAESPK